MAKIRQIRSKDKLPGWFSLRNYRYITNATNDEILNELFARMFICFGGIDSVRPLAEQDELTLASWERIKTGRSYPPHNSESDINRDAHNEGWKAYQDINRQLASGEVAVKPLSVWDVKILAKRFEFVPFDYSKNALLPQEPANTRGIEGLSDDEYFGLYSSISLFPSASIKGTAHIAIDLELSDKEITKELEKLLPLWRMDMQKRGLYREKPKKVMPSVWDKIRIYNALPCLDLLIWQRLEQVKIQTSVLDRVLFGGGRDGQGSRFIETTLEPFCNKLMNYKYLAALKSKV